MIECLEQLYFIKFYQKLGDTQAETVHKIHRLSAILQRGSLKSLIRFKDGRILADSDQLSGRPSTNRNADVIDKVWIFIMEDRHLTLWEIADEVGIS
jgi:hypothetical protein